MGIHIPNRNGSWLNTWTRHIKWGFHCTWQFHCASFIFYSYWAVWIFIKLSIWYSQIMRQFLLSTCSYYIKFRPCMTLNSRSCMQLHCCWKKEGFHVYNYFTLNQTTEFGCCNMLYSLTCIDYWILISFYIHFNDSRWL